MKPETVYKGHTGIMIIYRTGRFGISIFGRWLVGYFADNHGSRDWHLAGATVQGYSVYGLGC